LTISRLSRWSTNYYNDTARQGLESLALFSCSTAVGVAVVGLRNGTAH
jgi:hypothetical protein